MRNLEGSGGVKITGSVDQQQLGQVVSPAGDINNDGYADFLISCGDWENVYLIFGQGNLPTSFTTTASLSFPGVILSNPTTGGSFGISLSRAGDFNGDGLEDFLIGLLYGGSGRIYLVYGATLFPSPFEVTTMFAHDKGVLYYTGLNDHGGTSISGGVDFNQDGFADFLIGAPMANAPKGAAHLVFGSATPTDATVGQLGYGVITLYSSNQNSLFGTAVSLAENVFGDHGGTGLLVTASPKVFYLHDLFGSLAPSVSPTFPPTVVPTASPSMIPTPSPTLVPSKSPSAFPTVAPTFIPTGVSKASPTASPAEIPTLIPSITPMITPTTSPTGVPTEVPHCIPSQTPTVEPTRNPTVAPTGAPTWVPSVAPSEPPTFVSSVDPTMAPTAVPTVVPSFRPSAPTYSPSAVPTATPTRRTQGSIIINAGFTVNSVNGATLSPTSQETIKQSIANASQTTVNNVDLVSVTRTNRRLLSSSVVHRMLATVPLFSYKVVAEIHFNLIDFPGLNESYVAETKSKIIVEAVKTREFDRIISYYATINNATQLMNNTTVSDVIVITSVVAVPSSSEEGPYLSDGQAAGLVIGIILGTVFVTFLVYVALVNMRLHSLAQSKPVQSFEDLLYAQQKSCENQPDHDNNQVTAELDTAPLGEAKL
jgi:hypothetical protein